MFKNIKGVAINIDATHCEVINVHTVYKFKHDLMVKGKGSVIYNDFVELYKKYKSLIEIDFDNKIAKVHNLKLDIGLSNIVKVEDKANFKYEFSFNFTPIQKLKRFALNPSQLGYDNSWLLNINIDNEYITSSNTYIAYKYKHESSNVKPFILPRELFFLKGIYNVSFYKDLVLLENADESIIFKDSQDYKYILGLYEGANNTVCTYNTLDFRKAFNHLLKGFKVLLTANSLQSLDDEKNVIIETPLASNLQKPVCFDYNYLSLILKNIDEDTIEIKKDGWKYVFNETFLIVGLNY